MAVLTVTCARSSLDSASPDRYARLVATPWYVLRELYRRLKDQVLRARNVPTEDQVKAIRAYLAEFNERRVFFAPFPQEDPTAVVLSVEEFMKRTRTFVGEVEANPFASSSAGDLLDKLRAFNDAWKPRQARGTLGMPGPPEFWMALGELRIHTKQFTTVLAYLAEHKTLPPPEEGVDDDGEGQPRAAGAARGKAKGKGKAKSSPKPRSAPRVPPKVAPKP